MPHTGVGISSNNTKRQQLSRLSLSPWLYESTKHSTADLVSLSEQLEASKMTQGGSTERTGSATPMSRIQCTHGGIAVQIFSPLLSLGLCEAHVTDRHARQYISGERGMNLELSTLNQTFLYQGQGSSRSSPRQWKRPAGTDWLAPQVVHLHTP